MVGVEGGMSAATKIEWTRGDDGSAGATWNPVTGCTKVSEGCRHCYIDRTPPFRTQGRRFVGPHGAGEPGATTGVLLHPDRLDWPLRWRRPRRVFVNSLSDLSVWVGSRMRVCAMPFLQAKRVRDRALLSATGVGRGVIGRQAARTLAGLASESSWIVAGVDLVWWRRGKWVWLRHLLYLLERDGLRDVVHDRIDFFGADLRAPQVVGPLLLRELFELINLVLRPAFRS
jgi:hypothetical protein